MLFIDSHCHLHDARIYKEVPEIVARAKKVGVQYMVSCATMEENFHRTAGLASAHAAVIPCFGIHPWFIDNLSENWQQELETFLIDPGAGIGETGLDFMDQSADRDLQIQVFSHHIGLARELERPINIHIRKAWAPFIHLLKKIGPLKTPGVIHSYSGSADMVPLFEKYNLYISFSGAVTRLHARKVIKSMAAVSRDRLVLETDAPDIYPTLSDAGENKLNEPKNLPAIAQIAAGRLHMGFEEFVNRAYNNGLILFESILP
ncbi:MAG: TatD family hydrolase [Desulfobacteraceae bacterium]|nr:TatD family hydrolase [Desulfobacteraceae bacterium]